MARDGVQHPYELGKAAGDRVSPRGPELSFDFDGGDFDAQDGGRGADLDPGAAGLAPVPV